MFDFDVSVEGEIDITDAIAELSKIDGTEIEAGVEGDSHLEMIAMVQENGAHITPKKGKFLYVPMGDGSFVRLKSVTIPARSFLAKTLTEKLSEWQSEIQDEVVAVFEGGSLGGLLDKVGKEMQEGIQETIDETNSPANAPLTVARKGFNNPLVDTGNLRGSIQYKIKR